MTWDAKDKAMSAASTLIGYSLSASSLPLDSLPKEEFDLTKKWILGLLNAARLAAIAIETATDLAPSAPAQDEQTDWQPIETAPRNVSILIYLPGWEHYGPGIYRAILCDMGTGKRWHTSAWACGRDLGGDDIPTAWMPLPAPPAQDEP